MPDNISENEYFDTITNKTEEELLLEHYKICAAFVALAAKDFISDYDIQADIYELLNNYGDLAYQLGEAVGDVAHADKCQRLLHIVKRLLEAVQTADPAKGEMFTFCEAVGRSEVFKKLGRVPATIGK